MKYQALQALKTKTKVLGVMDSLEDAHRLIIEAGGRFTGFTYLGGFPGYIDEKNRHYNIQGLADCGMVCSISEKTLASFNFAAV